MAGLLLRFVGLIVGAMALTQCGSDDGPGSETASEDTPVAAATAYWNALLQEDSEVSYRWLASECLVLFDGSEWDAHVDGVRSNITQASGTPAREFSVVGARERPVRGGEEVEIQVDLGLDGEVQFEAVAWESWIMEDAEWRLADCPGTG